MDCTFFGWKIFLVVSRFIWDFYCIFVPYLYRNINGYKVELINTYRNI